MMRATDCDYCTSEKPCAWWCPICLVHHVVPSMVQVCLDAVR